MSKPDGRRDKRRRKPAQPDAGRAIVEDVDGVTCVVRTATPLTDDEREALRQFIERVLLNVDGEQLVDITVPSLVERSDALDQASAWLSRDQLVDVGHLDEDDPARHPDTSSWDGPL